MSERDLPKGTAADEALSHDEGIAALESILDGPDSDPGESNVQNAADPEEPEDEAAAAADGDDEEAETSEDSDDDEGSEADDEEDQDDDEEGDTLELSDELEIDLGDGRKATLAELKDHFGQVQKRVADFQRDYTRKTDALAQDRQEVETQGKRVMEWAEQIRRQRDLVMSLQQRYLPQPPSPEMMDDDPVGYMKQKAAYEDAVGQMQQMQMFMHQEQQQQTQQAEAERAKFLEAERAKMLEVFPELAKPEKLEQFRNDVQSVFLKAYDFTQEELDTVADHRFVGVIRDAIAYQKLKAKQPVAKAKMAGKPPVLRSGQSLSQKGKAAKDKAARMQALRRTGSLEAGINALMDLDL